MTSASFKVRGAHAGRGRLILAAVFLALLATGRTFAAYTGFSGFSPIISMDLPEGFKLVESSDDGKAFQLRSSIVPVDALVRIYPKDRYSSSMEALTDVLGKFRAEFESDSVEWRNQTGAIATFNAPMLGVPSCGYGSATVLPRDEGILVLLIWTSSGNGNAYAQFMASFIDSLCIDNGSYFETGMLTRYAYPPDTRKEDLTLEIDGKTIRTQIRGNDSEAAQFLIEREYAVLCLYQTSPLWREAWKRFYRMIYRDSCHRLMQVSFDVYNALAPDCSDETDLAQRLLGWVQGFEYEREQTASDFASLPGMLMGEGSDCDSRSMLLAVMLKSMNMDAVVFVSAEYSHALAGLMSDHPGFSFRAGEKSYLVGDTTIKGLSWGKMDAEQADQSKWLTVEFP